MYALMLAFVLLSGGLIYVALYATSSFAIGTVSHLAVGLTMLVLLNPRVKLARPMRVAAWATVLIGVAGVVFYNVPDDLGYLKEFVVGEDVAGHRWWNNLPERWIDAWITIGVITQLTMLATLAIWSLRRLNHYLLDREQSPGGTTSAARRPAA